MSEGKYDWLWQNELDQKKKDNQEKQSRTKKTLLTGILTVSTGLLYTITSVTGLHTGAYYYGLVIVATGLFIIGFASFYLCLLVKAKADLVSILPKPVSPPPEPDGNQECGGNEDDGMRRQTSYISTVTENSLSINAYTETTDDMDYGVSIASSQLPDVVTQDGESPPLYITPRHEPLSTKRKFDKGKKGHRSKSSRLRHCDLPNEVPIPIQ
ncbi:uncharacterized protein LOC144355880 [Saccoglossus kowalevskii]